MISFRVMAYLNLYFKVVTSIPMKLGEKFELPVEVLVEGIKITFS